MSAVYKVTLGAGHLHDDCPEVLPGRYGSGGVLPVGVVLRIVAAVARVPVAVGGDAPGARESRAASVVLVVLLPVARRHACPCQERWSCRASSATDEDRVVYAQSDGFLPRRRSRGVRVWAEPGALPAGECRDTSAVRRRRRRSPMSRGCSMLAVRRPIRMLPPPLNYAWLQADGETTRNLSGNAISLTITSPMAGVVTQILDERDTGRFIQKGDAVAKVAGGAWIVRCLATAEQMASAEPQVGEHVRVRIVSDGVRETTGTVEDVAVKGSRHVFSPLLSQLGGGDIPVVPGTLEGQEPAV